MSRLSAKSLNRRGFLKVGAVAGLGIGLADFLAIESAQAAMNKFVTPKVRAKSVIHIYLPGGLSAQETWDPKPLSPIEYRGEMRAINTKLPGVQFSEVLPKTAQVADKLTVIRSLTHGEAAHERGQHNMMTGYRPSPALQFPSFGSVVSHEFGPRKDLPPYISIPSDPNPYAGSGYLSSAFAPFAVGDDPARAQFKVRDLNLPGDVNQQRYEHRLAALEVANEQFNQRAASDAVSSMNAFYQRAFDLIGSPAAREAFDMSKEPNNFKDRYGRNSAGQRMLLARRLVEAGTRFVTLTYGSWDNHTRITGSMRSQMPAFDQGFAALLGDLDERGLLDDTLVMVSSEFGRTPKINGDAGRDHWSKVFSVVLAGGGIKRGAVIGSSGATANEPEETPISPEDLATTLYHQLGIAAQKELMAPGDRPIEIAKGGSVRKELLA
ncbi:MAG: DUF1501 domain-containing protein [Planctomycetes bacterium]|nr:DUF1501 domain-containing protein [Planctomycetota bacterium]